MKTGKLPIPKKPTAARFCPNHAPHGTLSRAPEYRRMNLAGAGARRDGLYTVLCGFIAFFAHRAWRRLALPMLRLRNNAASALVRGGICQAQRGLDLLPRTVTIALTTPARSVSEMTPGLGDFCLEIIGVTALCESCAGWIE